MSNGRTFEEQLAAAATAPNADWRLPAGEDLSAKQWHMVAVDASLQVKLFDPSVSILLVGVLQNAPREGEIAIVRERGVSKLRVTGTVAAGDFLRPDLDVGDKGRAQKFVFGTDGHNHGASAGNAPQTASLTKPVVGQAWTGGTDTEVYARLLFQLF
jgi:hypothetical protein